MITERASCKDKRADHPTCKKRTKTRAKARTRKERKQEQSKSKNKAKQEQEQQDTNRKKANKSKKKRTARNNTSRHVDIAAVSDRNGFRFSMCTVSIEGL